MVISCALIDGNVCLRKFIFAVSFLRCSLFSLYIVQRSFFFAQWALHVRAFVDPEDVLYRVRMFSFCIVLFKWKGAVQFWGADQISALTCPAAADWNTHTHAQQHLFEHS
jgi:hypothetical protein